MSVSILLDLDGNLVNNWTPLKGSAELIDFLNDKKIPYLIVTNRVSKTAAEIEKILLSIGFKIPGNCVVTPLVALDKFIKDNKIEKYFFVGSEYQKSQISHGLNTDESPEYVILCDFENSECNYALLNKIFQLIKNGSKIIAASYSDYYVSGTEFKLDTGIFVKMYESLTNEKAIITGKPSTLILQMAAAGLKTKTANTVIIGDDVFSDITGGKKLGFKTILVKTGIYKEGDEQKCKPDFIVNDLCEAIEIVNAFFKTLI